MKDIKIPYLPPIDCLKAKEIAEKYLTANGYDFNSVSHHNLPVNIENICERSGYELIQTPELQTKFGIKGMAFKNTKSQKFQIYVDSLHYMSETESAPFTIAEELSHILLHYKIFENINSIEDRYELEQSSTESNHQYIEQQAKRLASELLLPSIAFEKYVDGWFAQNLAEIEKDVPMNEYDLTKFVTGKLWGKLGLSQQIISRALHRPVPEKLIAKMVTKYKIKYIDG